MHRRHFALQKQKNKIIIRQYIDICEKMYFSKTTYPHPHHLHDISYTCISIYIIKFNGVLSFHGILLLNTKLESKYFAYGMMMPTYHGGPFQYMHGKKQQCWIHDKSSTGSNVITLIKLPSP
jgi:hypothetical protein